MKQEKQSAPVTVGKPQYRPMPMNMGFVIMGHDGDPSKIATTVKSIQRSYENVKTTIVVPEMFKKSYKGAKVGGSSVTSLINTGMEHAPAEWNVMVFAGVIIKERLHHRYSAFMESRLDVFYPLVWGNDNFIDATLNGLAIHRDTFAEVGQLSNDNSLEICKMMWFLEASEKGCKFKAIAGCRMC